MFLYFLKDQMNVTQDTLNTSGLDYLKKAEFTVTNGCFPMGTGSLIGYSRFHKSGDCLIKYSKTNQKWIPLNEEKSVYIGYYTDKELDLTQLIRSDNKLNTLPFQFSDGRVYQIPVAKYLPVCFTLADDGADKMEVEERYRDLAEIAAKYDAIYRDVVQVEGDLKEFSIDIAKCVSKTYSVGLKEFQIAKLVTSSNAYLFWVTFLQLHEIADKIEAFQADNQKKS